MSYYRNAPYRGGGGIGGIAVPPFTPVVRAVMIACGAIWAVQFVLVISRGIDLSPVFGVVPPKVAAGAFWQPVTYMWFHAPRDPMHPLFNLLFLWMVGGELERHWGPRRFLSYYLACGIGAGLVILAAGWLSGSPFPTVGASGAVYGLILAYGTVFAERVVLFMMVFPMKARTFAWVMFGLAFLFTWGPETGVSHVAHLGGMAVGWLFLRRVWRVGEFWRELRWRLRRRRFKVLPRDEDPDRWVN